MEKNISTIIFDFGNVLIDLDIPGFQDQIQDLLGLPTEEEKQMIDEVMDSYECGLISNEFFINRIIKLSRKPVHARDIIQCWNSMLVGIKPDTLKTLQNLRLHYKTYILSNTNQLHIEWVHKHLKDKYGIDEFEKEYLHGAFYSHEMKMAKPDPEIYKEVQSTIDVPPDQIVFIDDLEENVVGARNAGWRSTVHKPGSSITKTLQPYITQLQ